MTYSASFYHQVEGAIKCLDLLISRPGTGFYTQLWLLRERDELIDDLLALDFDDDADDELPSERQSDAAIREIMG